VRQLDGLMRAFEQQHGRSPTEEELQHASGLGLKDVRQGLEALQNQFCLPLDAIQESLTHEPGIVTEGEPFLNAATQEMVSRVASLIDTLTPRERLVLSLYYSDELNMRETAEVMGITEGRVSQLHSQALCRLRREFQQQYGGFEI
jgi:RNA polymerase sigma factor for flagellar operon FliA